MTFVSQNLKESPYSKVKAYAFRRLSAQSYHSEQLAKLLSKKQADDKTIKCVIEECKRLGLINDDVWVKNFIQSQKRKNSFKIIISKLLLKGLHPETVKEIINREKPDDETETIQLLLNTRYKSKNLSDYNQRQKVKASLLRKGFNFEQINIVFRNN